MPDECENLENTLREKTHGTTRRELFYTFVWTKQCFWRNRNEKENAYAVYCTDTMFLEIINYVRET